jgi:hypothetical protein
MSGIQKEYGPRGFQAVGIAFNDMAAMLVPDFVQRFQVTFPVGYAKRDAVVDYLQRPSILQTYVPIMVFIDRKGVIRGQYLGDDKFFQTDQEKNIRAEIEKLLSESPTPTKKSAKQNATKKK